MTAPATGRQVYLVNLIVAPALTKGEVYPSSSSRKGVAVGVKKLRQGTALMQEYYK